MRGRKKKVERKRESSNGLNIVSLFSGIGGLDLGFMYSGYNIIWANDFEFWGFYKSESYFKFKRISRGLLFQSMV